MDRPIRTLVTGASRGIGRAICERLASENHLVVGIAREPNSSFPGELVLADLADEGVRGEAFASIAGRYQIGALINSAGISGVFRLQEVRLADFRRTMEINVCAALHATQVFVPNMIAQGGGRVVNIGSRAMMGRPGISSYAASKAALDAMGRVWALELADKGVTVNTVAPGFINTEMFERNNPPGSARREMAYRSTPMKRIGTPDEVAAAVSYFLSPGAAFTTGQTLFVCGGWSIQSE